MPSFAQRSSHKELLDQEGIPVADLHRNLKELHFINRVLGGYRVIFKGIQQLISGKNEQAIHILDIGSGGGDTLGMIEKKFGRKADLKLTGVDLKVDCIEYASNRYPKIQFVQNDYRKLMQQHEQQFDIITASLFCHHLSNEELIEFLRWMDQHAQLGFVINDLHRHPFAYYAIKWLTRLFSRSYLVKNDGALSVLRAFRKKELQSLMAQGGIKTYRIQWIWAFRWLLVVRKNN